MSVTSKTIAILVSTLPSTTILTANKLSPEEPSPGVAILFGGYLTDASGVGIPYQTIKIYTDGLLRGSAQTDATGYWEYSIPFKGDGSHEFDAVFPGAVVNPGAPDPPPGPCQTDDDVVTRHCSGTEYKIWQCSSGKWVSTGIVPPCGDPNPEICQGGNVQPFDMIFSYECGSMYSPYRCTIVNGVAQWKHFADTCTKHPGQPTYPIPWDAECWNFEGTWETCPSGWPRLTAWCKYYKNVPSNHLTCPPYPSVTPKAPVIVKSGFVHTVNCGRSGDLVALAYGQYQYYAEKCLVYNVVTRSIVSDFTLSKPTGFSPYIAPSVLMTDASTVYVGWSLWGTAACQLLLQRYKSGVLDKTWTLYTKTDATELPQLTDIILLADGKIFGAWRFSKAPTTTGLIHHQFFRLDADDTVAVSEQVTTPFIGIMNGYGNTMSQHPADGKIWVFFNSDGSDDLRAIRIAEDFTVSLNTSTYTSEESMGIDTNYGEDPFIYSVPDPLRNQVLLLYPSLDYYHIETADGRLSVCSPVSLAVNADGSKTVTRAPFLINWLETRSLVIGTDGKARMIIRPINPNFYWDVCVSMLENGYWTQPIPVFKSGYGNFASSPQGFFARRDSDGMICWTPF